MSILPAADGRSVLFVAYHFPPMRSAGVERSAKFVRYLPEYGYQPRVLSTNAFGGHADDDVLRAWEPIGAYRKRRNAAARTDPAAASRTRTPRSAWARAVRRWLFVPDGQITWLPGAAWTALSQLRRQPADLLFTTAPPWSSLLLGRFLKQQTGLPWVVDFRDAWLYDPLDPALLTTPWRRDLESRLEAEVLAEADAVLTATSTTAQNLRDRYAQHADKIRVVTNGFDPEDAVPLPEGLVIDQDTRVGPATPADDEPDLSVVDRPHGRMRLVHTGSFSYSHPQRTPLPLLQALRRLVELEPIWAERLELILVGELSPEESEAAQGVARVVGAVDRATALGYQRRADVLLVVDHERPWPASNAPGKLYEYLGAEKPVLALCGPGEIERIVTDLQAGLCVPPDDIDAIDDALRHLWELYDEHRLPQAQTSLTPFHRRELTRQLAGCFDEVLSR